MGYGWDFASVSSVFSRFRACWAGTVGINHNFFLKTGYFYISWPIPKKGLVGQLHSRCSCTKPLQSVKED